MTRNTADGDYRGTVLVVEDMPANINVLFDALERDGIRALAAKDGETALDFLERARPDVILLDVMMPGLDGFETARLIKANPETRDIPIIFLTALDDAESKVRGFNVGAVDYITKPIRTEEALSRVNAHLRLRLLRQELEQANERLEERVQERTAELRSALGRVDSLLKEVTALKNKLQDENVRLKREIGRGEEGREILGESEAMKEAIRQAALVAKSDATAIILGETGAGKELIARAVHRLSDRREKQLVKVNCAALPENLIESELFGHEKGAFTGAVNRSVGRFELADGGTLFLDEIGDLPLALQAKLLRALQEGEFERVGGSRTIKADVRVVAATNRDLRQALERGTFREDLFYRLNVFPIRVPPLRERRGDVPILARAFVERFAKRQGREPLEIPPDVMKKFEAYRWPGNVRELENVIERATILSRGAVLSFDEPLAAEGTLLAASESPATLAEVERAHIRNTLEKTGGKIEGENGAAKILGINPSTLRARMNKHGITRPV
jgi:formate hydrogenlyase transcriptional activator